MTVSAPSGRMPLLRSMPTVLLLMAADLTALFLSASASWWLKSLADPSLSVMRYLQVLPFVGGGLMVIFGLQGLYPGIGMGSATELRRLSLGCSTLIGATIVLTFFSQNSADWSRQILLTTCAFCLIAIPISRASVRRLCCRSPWWGIPVAVLGAGATGSQIIALLHSRPWMGLRPVAAFDDASEKAGSDVHGVPIIGTLSATNLLRQHRITHAILAIPSMSASDGARLLDRLGDQVRHIYIAPALPGSPDLIAETREFANTLVLEVQQNLLRPEARLLKRILDIVSVIMAVLLFGWLFAFIALAVKAGSRGPVFYGQHRIGRDGKVFTAWKFRSMVADAETRLKSYLDAHPELREEWERDHKLKNDPRVTWVGKLLRRTSLDELPQFWNILRGEMSLVGPRPIVDDEIVKYGDHFLLYQKVRPGLSGLWQVSGRNDTSYAERVALDCYYVRNWSVWLDLVVISRTIRVVLLGKGAY